MSLIPRRVISTVISSSTSCNASRSPVTISTSMPSCSAWVARVAMTSSASNPGALTIGTASASHTSRISDTCPRKSEGVSERFALYSAKAS